MKKLIVILFIISSNLVFAQNTAVLEINSALTNTQSSARDLIKIKPGSVIKANSGGNSKVFINKAIELPAEISSSNYINGTNGNIDRTLDQNLPLGKTPSSFNVNSSNGSLEYTIPLNTPVGNGNVFQGLSLYYSSTSNNGACGKGWNISLPGGINRENKNLYQDNVIERFNFDENDVFSYNGNRLYKSVDLGTYKEYKTENESFDQIVSFHDIGAPYPNFTIKTKNELTLNTVGYIPQNAQLPLFYAISDIVDNYGNRCLYQYGNDNGEFFLKEINYGNHLSNNLPYSIKFYYDIKNEPTEKYSNGFKIKEAKILREISIYSSGLLLRSYKLSYNNDVEGNYLLSELQEFNGKGETFNSLLFNYNEVNSISDTKIYNLFIINSYSKQFLIDFNSDGLKDIISFNGTRTIQSDGSSTVNWQNWKVYKNTGNEDFRFSNVSTNTNFPPNFELKQSFQYDLNTVGGFSISIFDYNGDGFEDLYLRGVDNSISQNVLKADGSLDLTLNGSSINVYLSNGTGISSTPTSFLSYLAQNLSISNGLNSALFVGDFNGDRVSDILNYFAWQQGKSKFHFYQNSQGTLNDLNYRIDFSNAFVSDYDGDGISDIINCVIDNPNATLASVVPGKYALKFDSNRNFQLVSLNTGYALNKFFNPVSGCVAVDEVLNLIGDYNGDGYLDNLITVNNALYSYDWKGYINKGNNSELVFGNTLGLKSPFSSQNRCRLVHAAHDMNGDGLTDVLEFDNNNSNVTTLSVFYSLGNQFSFTKIDYSIPSRVDYDNNTVNFGDFNGDGIEDIYITSSLTAQPLIVYMYRTSQTSLLKEVLDGFNVSTKFYYSKLNSFTNYSQNLQNNSDLINYKGPTSVIDKIVYPDGIGGNTELSFSYKNYLIHKKGKGILGFTEFSKSNSSTLLKDELIVDYGIGNSDYFTPKITTSKTYLTATGQQLSLGVNTYEIVPLSTINKRIFYYLKSNSYNDLISNVNNVTNYTYNTGNGTLTSKEDVNVNTGIKKITAYSNYIAVGTDNNLLPTVPKQITHTSIDGVNPNISKTTNIEYNLNEGSIKSNTIYPGTTGEIIHNYTYTTFGKLKEDNITAYNLPLLSSKFEYDATGLFLIKTINPEEEFETVDYNKYTGHALTQTNVQSQKTYFEYDGWGNQVSQIAPDNNRINVERGWISGAQIPGTHETRTSEIISYKKVFGQGMPYVIEYYDIYGRVVLVEKEGFSGKIFQGKEYNAKGQIIKETNNYEIVNPQCSTLFTIYNYDDYNRIKLAKVTDDLFSPSAGLNTTYNYQNLSNGDLITTITTPDNYTSSKTTNALSYLISSTDNGGNITYEYFADGKLKNTKVNGIVTNSIVYDDFGNQKELNEVNSGKTKYQYDALGNLRNQTDANLNSYDLTYDKLGRIKTKSGPDGVYTYNYVLSGKALGNLESVSGPNNAIMNYEYDDLARVTKITEGTSTKNFITQLQYDQYNRLINKKYASDFSVNYEYNSIGVLTKIIQADNNQTLWQINGMLPNGIINKYTYGNGLASINTYDNYSNIKKQQTGNVFDLEYNINPVTGNLDWRKDNVAQLKEDFKYDNLNRLTKFQPDLNATFLPNSITYKSNGNIETKTDAGNYEYNLTRLNAVETVTNPVPAISLTQQDISYTPFKKVATISENNLQYNITYGVNQQRIKSVLTQSGVTNYTRYYASNFEQTINNIGQVTDVTYIESPSGICAMNVNDNGNKQLFYVHSDHLGSINTLTNTSGTVATYNGNVLKQSFDAWGRRRNYSNWSYDNINTLPQWLSRGYTGHEHLNQFNLINMNGRMYDPVLGRMLSPDIFAQAPDFTQSHNRYSYCLNNPLKYSDPSGNTWEKTVRNGLDKMFIPFRVVDAPFSAASDRMNGNKNANYFNKQYLLGNQAPYAASGGTSPGSSQYSATKMGGTNNHLDPQYSNYDDMYDALNDGVEVPIFGYAGIGVQFNAQKRNGDWVNQYDVKMEERYIKGFYTLRYNNSLSNKNNGPLHLTLENVLDKKALWYNYIGPGSSKDPRYLLSLGLKPLNMLDYAAYLHDYRYYINRADGVTGALFNLNVAGADAKLAYDAMFVAKFSTNVEETRRAYAVAAIFTPISIYKAFAIGASENYNDNNFIK